MDWNYLQNDNSVASIFRWPDKVMVINQWVNMIRIIKVSSKHYIFYVMDSTYFSYTYFSNLCLKLKIGQ